jgi:nitrate/nitrite transporter NarK
MRGRPDLVNACPQITSGAFCIGLGNAYSDLQATTACIAIFAFTAQASEGVVYSIVPFVSKRSLGAISGLVGAGGSAGGVVLQVCSSHYIFVAVVFWMVRGHLWVRGHA